MRATRSASLPDHDGSNERGLRSRFTFRLATEDDDLGLRQLLRDTPMDGPIQMSLCREPDYFAASSLEGETRQTLLAAESRTGRVVGCGARSVRNRFVDGKPTSVGYLSGLRIHPEFRRGTILARGYRELRRLHENDRAAGYYLSTVVKGNDKAAAALTDRRAGLPSYDSLGTYHTFALPFRRRQVQGDPHLNLRTLERSELPQLIDFLNRQGRRRLFFPRYDEQDFFRHTSTFRDLRPDDILTAWRDDELVGALGLWNQRCFKQCIIHGYQSGIRLIRPAFNLLARAMDWPTFPQIGQAVRPVYAAFPTAMDDQTLSDMIVAARRIAPVRYPDASCLLIGCHELDSFANQLQQMCLYRFDAHVYVVHWDGDAGSIERLRGRNLYLELGCL